MAYQDGSGPMRAPASFSVMFSFGQASESRGRLARSSACRHWHLRRQHARETGVHPPLWVIMSPPWPILRLALRIAGKSTFRGLFLLPLGLLASSNDELASLPFRELDKQADDKQARTTPRQQASLFAA